MPRKGELLSSRLFKTPFRLFVLTDVNNGSPYMVMNMLKLTPSTNSLNLISSVVINQ